jgi:hypothetical protein
MKKTLLISGLLFVSFSVSAVAFATSTGANLGSSWNSACIQAAVEKRETAIISATDTLSVSVKASLEKRKAALISAWGMSNAKERKTARNAAWATFRSEQKTARSAHLSAVKSAWTTWKTEASACKINAAGVEPEGLDVTVSASATNCAAIQ